MATLTRKEFVMAFVLSRIASSPLTTSPVAGIIQNANDAYDIIEKI